VVDESNRHAPTALPVGAGGYAISASSAIPPFPVQPPWHRAPCILYLPHAHRQDERSPPDGRRRRSPPL